MKIVPKSGILTAVAAAAMATCAHADTLAFNTGLADGYYNGTGNPNVGFTTLTTDQLELGLGTNIRFVAPVLPSPSNSAVYNVPTGFASGGALWDFEYSVDWQPGFSLGADHWDLTVLNTKNGQTVSFDPSLTLLGDATNGHGFQNAENLGFGFIGLLNSNFNYDPNQNDTFLVTLSLQDPNNDIIAGLSETINQTPLPAALPLFAGGLGLMSLFGLRRKKKAALATRQVAA